jgi:exonuclease III
LKRTTGGNSAWSGSIAAAKNDLYHQPRNPTANQQHPEPGRETWWDYRAGNFHKSFGMRIDHLLVTAPLRHRVVWAEIDREARKGKPI